MSGATSLWLEQTAPLLFQSALRSGERSDQRELGLPSLACLFQSALRSGERSDVAHRLAIGWRVMFQSALRSGERSDRKKAWVTVGKQVSIRAPLG